MKTRDNNGILSAGMPLNTNDKAKALVKTTPDADPAAETTAAMRLSRVIDMTAVPKYGHAKNHNKINGQNANSQKNQAQSAQNKHARRPPETPQRNCARTGEHSAGEPPQRPQNNFSENNPSYPEHSKIMRRPNKTAQNKILKNNPNAAHSSASDADEADARRVPKQCGAAAGTCPPPIGGNAAADRFLPPAAQNRLSDAGHAANKDPSCATRRPFDPAAPGVSPSDAAKQTAAHAPAASPNDAAAARKTAAAPQKKHAVRVSFKPVAKREHNIAKLRKHAPKCDNAGASAARSSAGAHAESLKIEQALMLQSWQACQWCDAITDMTDAVSAHLPKAIPLVSAGLVNNICVTPGCIEATIFDQVISIEVRQFALGQWRNVIAMLSDRAIFTTSLLNGELPQGLADIFKQSSLSLFPSKLREFSFQCNCKPAAQPCEHACAVLIAFAQKLEEDPFNIIALRGMTRDNLLALIRSARSDQVVDEKTRYRITYELPAQSVSFSEFYSPRELRDGQDAIESLNFHISYAPATLLRRLGTPSAWRAPISVESVLQPIIDAAAREAEMLGQCEHYEIPGTDAQKQTKPAKNQTMQNAPQSRAPRNSNNARECIPDMAFVASALPGEILADLGDDPVRAAKDIYRWLLTRGASDIRTLARRTRLNKTTIEAFLNAFCEKGFVVSETIGDKIRFNLAAPPK